MRWLSVMGWIGCASNPSVGLDKPTVSTGDTPPATTGVEVVDPSAPLFDDSVLHHVEITLEAADWESLRRQDRSIIDMFGEGCMEAPWDSPFTWFDADVVFDGVALPSSAVRKKGLLGSLSYDRPSLRIDTDRNVSQSIGGLTALTLNNNNQDPIALRTCLTYAVFRNAGMVAPRCSLARVTVNGEDLGFYSHVELVDETLVQRHRGVAPASLYEGTLSDFREGWIDTFDAETADSDRADLARLAEALTVEDAALFEALEPLVDLDQVFTFWAAEVLTAHWDGYSYNTNNFFVYRDGADDRLRLIPWGPDGSFQPEEDTTWVYTAGALSNRLIAHPDGRERYGLAMEALIEGGWAAADLPAMIDRLAELTADDRTDDMRRDQRALAAIVDDRASRVLAAMDDHPGTVEEDLRDVSCLTEHGSLTMNFESTWGSYGTEDYFSWGGGAFVFEIDGVTYTSDDLGVVAGEDGGLGVLVAIGEIAPEVYLAPYVTLDLGLVAPGDVVLDGSAALGQVLYSEPGVDWNTAAYLGPGILHFSEGGTGRDTVLRGTIEAPVLGW